MHTWPVIILLIAFIFLLAILHLVRHNAISKSRGQVLILTSHGIISSSIIILLISIWHFHMIWGEWIHFHPESLLCDIVVITIGELHVDLLTVLVLIPTALIYIIAIIYSQVKLRSLYHRLKGDNLNILSEKVVQKFPFVANMDLFIIDNSDPLAFSFSRLTHIIFPKVIDCIVISTGLLDILDDDEIEAVLAHEYGHCQNHDTRYAHLIVTLRSLLRFDPVIKKLEKYLNRQQEFNADEFSVNLTNKPKSLARALFKLLEFEYVSLGVSHLMSETNELLLERIDRLLKMDTEIQIINQSNDREKFMIGISQ